MSRNPDDPLYDPNDDYYSDDEELGYLGLTLSQAPRPYYDEDEEFEDE